METFENCPRCGKKMERGYITAAQLIYWSKEKTSRWIRAGDEHLVGSRWSGTCSEAYRCPNCKIVLFSYGKETGKE